MACRTCMLHIYHLFSFSQSRKDEEMRKRRNINEDEEEDITPGGYGSAFTIETLQSLVMVGVA